MRSAPKHREIGFQETAGFGKTAGCLKNQGFIYYTVDVVIEKMGCCKQKAVKLLKELKEIGLIECERIGLTKPNRIYVKTYY